jgi:hypothetical protein
MAMYSLLVLGILALLAPSMPFVPTVLPHQRMQSLRLWSTTSNDEYAYLERVREGMAEAGLQDEWTSAAQTLAESVLMDMEQAEHCLSVALNWKRWAIVTSPIARKFIKTAPPDSAAVTASLQWLRQGPLAVSDNSILKAAILQYPEAYLLSPAENYRQALQVAPAAYQNPDVFRELLLRDPAILQCTYNCVDNGCNSECGNCWVSFEYKSSESSSSNSNTAAW